MAKITFNIATANGPVPVEGVVANLMVGDKKRKFVLHDGVVSDFKTGFKIGDLSSEKARVMAARGPLCVPSDRRAAQDKLDRLCAQLSAPEVLRVIGLHPTINGRAA